VNSLQEIVGRFPKRRIIVVGDLIADQFLNGKISRVSREAPVFILKHESTDTLPGGAANAAANIASLGGKAVLVSPVGCDKNGDLVMAQLVVAGVADNALVREPSLTTTTKLRVLAGQHYAARQQVIRIDYESSPELPDEVQSRLVENLCTEVDRADAVIVSDYGCGAVFPEIYAAALAKAKLRKIPIVVDSRYRLTDFAAATTATPNREEVETLIDNPITHERCNRLREQLNYDALLVTNGNKGMMLLEKDQPPVELDAVGPKEPVDVTGAGDTVIAAYTMALACGGSFADAAMIANHAGGLVVMKKRTATVGPDELLRSLGEVVRAKGSPTAN
jgi:rfaE bifunctional protein kinase chain/domain